MSGYDRTLFHWLRKNLTTSEQYVEIAVRLCDHVGGRINPANIIPIQNDLARLSIDLQENVGKQGLSPFLGWILVDMFPNKRDEILPYFNYSILPPREKKKEPVKFTDTQTYKNILRNHESFSEEDLLEAVRILLIEVSK